jgi:hypothetical protein
MSSRYKSFLTFPLLAVLLVACNLTTSGGALAASPTPDLVQTLTALAPAQIQLSQVATGTSTTEVPLIPAESETPLPTETSLPALPTNTPVLPTSTHTPVPPTATQGGVPVVQITPVFVSTAPVVATAIPGNFTRISFQSNATSASLSDSLTGGQVKAYALRVMANQVMIVNLSAPNQDAVLAVSGLTSGQVFLDASSNQSSWQGRVPTTQDYIVQVISRGAAANFSLSVTIPENLSFQAGAISASRSYPLRAREMHTLLLRATAGQNMTLTLTPSDQTVLLGFYGYQDGQPYLRTVAGQTSWTGTVPATQDYVIQVESVVDNATSFRLDVNIQ